MSESDWPRRVTIVGLGLMGGSLGLAIRRAYPRVQLFGVDRDRRVVVLALKLGLIERGAPELSAELASVDLVLLATPVGAILEILPRLPELIGAGTLVSDLGSTKAQICKMGERLLPGRFIGGHPLAGSERSGLAAADPGLLRGAPYALTPCGDVQGPTLERLARFLRVLGARVLIIGPEEHDRIVARTSHLAQLLSVALAGLIVEKGREDERYLRLCGGGLRDMTRLAASPYAIWRDVLRTNAGEIDRALGEFREILDCLQDRLVTGDLQAEFARAGELIEHSPANDRPECVEPVWG